VCKLNIDGFTCCVVLIILRVEFVSLTGLTLKAVVDQYFKIWRSMKS